MFFDVCVKGPTIVKIALSILPILRETYDMSDPCTWPWMFKGGTGTSIKFALFLQDQYGKLKLPRSVKKLKKA